MWGAKSRKYVSSGTDWAAELYVTFAAGFVVSSLLWLGVYFYQARPAQAGALQAQEVVLEETEADLQQCALEREEYTEANKRLESEKKAIGKELKQARIGWGRCLRGEGRPEE
jgi:hypothetical protein